MGQRVLPVFYDVDPSDVRGQKGSFHIAFQEHEVKFVANMEKVKRYREALLTVASLSGWDVARTASGSEAECIKQIVRKILSYNEPHPADNLVGMELRVPQVKSLLAKGSDDVCMVGIWGMGGIGKTTIARAVYRQIWYEFQGSSFLEDVRENGFDKKGLKTLQEKLLSEILMEKDFKVRDCDDGIRQIQRRLGRKKVLVVLDDVDNFKQLEFLAGAHEWFGPGSRIIIITRDEHLLCYAQEKYVPELLKETEAMKLFSRFAFKANIPPKAYEEVSRTVVSHTGHLPLALKILGSHFCGRKLDFWQSAINVLARIPHKEINGILEISYHGLNILEKKIFLYIACFFKGRKRYQVTRILDSLCLEAVSGITVLIEKSLLTVSNGYLEMHDLIEEMGRCILLECSPNNMVWHPMEILEVMSTNDRLETVEAIVSTDYILCFSEETLKSMKNLRLLEVRGCFFRCQPTHFPQGLRWFSWAEYMYESLELTRDMSELVGLELPYSEIQHLQVEKKAILANLKFMNLRNSDITSFPDVSGIPNLEWLDLSLCSNLMEIHQSVMLHERIIHLDIGGCHSLEILPPCIQMKTLQTLSLSFCRSLQRLPEISKETGRLSVLKISGCSVMERLPSSVRLLTGLTILTVGIDDNYCYMKKVCLQDLIHLSRLRILNLEGNNIVNSDFPRDMSNAWPSLEELCLSFNLMIRIPASISHLSHLKYLDLRNCNKLKELPKLPSLIQVLIADHCKSLEKIEDLSNRYKWLFQISLSLCRKLVRDKKSRSHLDNMSMKSLVQKCAAVKHRLSITIPGREIPEWFSNQSDGNTIDLNLSQNQITKMIGLAICCIFGPARNEKISKLIIKIKPSSKENLIKSPASRARGSHPLWIGYMSMDFLGKVLCHGSEDDLILKFNTRSSMVKCGVCVVYEDDIKWMSGRTRSWIPYYDELRLFDVDGASGSNLPRGRVTLPKFSFQDEMTAQIHAPLYCPPFVTPQSNIVEVSHCNF